MSDNEAPRIYPTFRYRDAPVMMDWLAKTFGFLENARFMDGELVAHGQMSFGSSMIMLGSARDDAFCRIVGEPGEMQSGKSIYIAVADPDALFERAKAAGAKIIEEPVDRDYGSREFICADPEGNIWSFGTYWPKTGETEA